MDRRSAWLSHGPTQGQDKLGFGSGKMTNRIQPRLHFKSTGSVSIGLRTNLALVLLLLLNSPRDDTVRNTMVSVRVWGVRNFLSANTAPPNVRKDGSALRSTVIICTSLVMHADICWPHELVAGVPFASRITT